MGTRLAQATFRNPVLPGPHPDPSVCRVGDDFYLVTSTFEYFPGLPVHRSRDLVRWQLIGHVLDRPEQLDLDGVRPSGGLYAPTIRHHDGVFYAVCTLVDGRSRSGNFVVTATDPAGPWSNPVWLDTAEGFDPSLLFEPDGRAWYCATRQLDDAGHTAVWVQEFDSARLELVGERHDIWSGALVGARWAEAPHLYHIGDAYYLLTAEGGTSMEHAVVVARSASITGPYVGCPRNPVLTHRHLGESADIVAVGHADLVQTQAGEWWAVLLGVRDGERGNLGRETFLTPLEWDADGWPLFNPGVGSVELEGRRPDLPSVPWPPSRRVESFDDAELGPEWMFLRTPRERWWSLRDRPGHLRLQARAQSLVDHANPSFVGRRLQHRHFTASAAIEFEPRTPAACAGLAIVYSDAFQLRAEITADPGEGGERLVRVVRREAGNDEVVASVSVAPGPVRLWVEGDGPEFRFDVADSAGGWRTAAHVDGSHLSYRVAGGFFGAMVGVFATGNGVPDAGHADVDWFEYGPA